MKIPEYQYIYQYIDKLLSRITKIDIVKARIIMFIHYSIMYMKTFKLLLGKINYIWWLCILLLILIILINIKYDGCPLLKMERKYMKDKEWFGPYYLPVKMGLLTKEQIMPFFYVIQVLILIIISYRLVIHFYQDN